MPQLPRPEHPIVRRFYTILLKHPLVVPQLPPEEVAQLLGFTYQFRIGAATGAGSIQHPRALYSVAALGISGALPAQREASDQGVHLRRANPAASAE